MIGCSRCASTASRFIVGQVGLAVPSSSPSSLPPTRPDCAPQSSLSLGHVSRPGLVRCCVPPPLRNSQARPPSTARSGPSLTANSPPASQIRNVAQSFTPPPFCSQSNRTSRSTSVPAQADATHFVTPRWRPWKPLTRSPLCLSKKQRNSRPARPLRQPQSRRYEQIPPFPLYCVWPDCRREYIPLIAAGWHRIVAKTGACVYDSPPCTLREQLG